MPTFRQLTVGENFQCRPKMTPRDIGKFLARLKEMVILLAGLTVVCLLLSFLAACSQSTIIPVNSIESLDTSNLVPVAGPAYPQPQPDGSYLNEDLVEYTSGVVDALNKANFIIYDMALTIEDIKAGSKGITVSQ